MSARPPDPALVAQAIEALRDWIGYEPEHTWELVETLHLKNSTVQFIDLKGEDGRVRLVYKTKESSGGRAWFDDGPLLTNEAARLLREVGLRASPVLAYDVDRCVVITLYIDGQTIRPLRWSDRQLDHRQRETFLDIGRGALMLESVAGPIADSDLAARIWEDFARRLSAVRIEEALRKNVEATALQSFESASSSEEPFVPVHTDLTFNNTVVEDGVPGFIDISFSRGLRGTSLAKFLHKLEFSSQLASPSTQDAQQAVIEGFGGEPEALPFLRITRIIRMVGPTRGPLGVVSTRRRRALRALQRVTELV